MAYSEDVTKLFTGILNSANISRTGLTYTLTSWSPGWHLLGNPYPCALQWNQTTGAPGWNTTNIDGVCKTWNEVNASYSDISAGEIIPAMQGFMVHLSSESTGSLTIPATDRTHTSQNWYKADPVNRLKITLHETDTEKAQECIIKFLPEATKDFDTDFDSRFLKGYAPAFYAVAGEEHLSTNALPAFDENLVIPLGFEKNESSSYKIEVKGPGSLVPEHNVYLKDMKLNYTQDLHKEATYYFTADEGDSPLRFKLLFRPETEEGSADNILVYQANGQLMVSFGEPVDASLAVYNITGQLMARREVQQQSTCSVDIRWSTGAYIVAIRTPEYIVSKKVITY